MTSSVETSSSRLPLRIDIVSDVVCPWCIIGYKQLQKALEALPQLFTPEVHWHPFELNPQMPAEGQELREHIQQKYGPSAGGGSGGRKRLTDLGISLGFEFDYFDGMRMVNTFAAHQLLHWAGQQGLQTELKLALFEAFFQRRENVSDVALLVQVAQRVGLDEGEASSVLTEAIFADLVREEQNYWHEQEVHAVPTFYFQQQYLVPGAQEATTFERMLKKIHAKETEKFV